MRLRLTRDYELKLKDLERVHMERLQTTKLDSKRAFDLTLENMKKIYDEEIKALKSTRRDLEDRCNNLKRELIKKEGDI